MICDKLPPIPVIVYFTPYSFKIAHFSLENFRQYLNTKNIFSNTSSRYVLYVGLLGYKLVYVLSKHVIIQHTSDTIKLFILQHIRHVPFLWPCLSMNEKKLQLFNELLTVNIKDMDQFTYSK